jgi:hypothetical protein
MNVKMELLKRGCNYKNEVIKKAIDDAYEQIITIVKECGGVLKTPACDEKITLYAFYLDNNQTSGVEKIFGLRYDDELGLCIATESMIENYTFDTGFYFNDYQNFEGEDADELNKMLDDPAYYVEFDKYGLVYTDTVISIIGGIADYL